MKKRNVVYSTDKGKTCPACGEAVTDCQCRRDVTQGAGGDGIVRLQRQTKGRAGKPVTIVTGLSGTRDEIKAIAKNLKKKCGVGGTVEDGNIVIQGDQRDVIKAELESAGHVVKLSGG